MTEELRNAKDFFVEHRAMLKYFADRAKKYPNRKALGSQYKDSEMWSMMRGSQALILNSRKKVKIKKEKQNKAGLETKPSKQPAQLGNIVLT